MPTTITIDIEPTWVGIARNAHNMSNQNSVRILLKELETACAVADKVRQAQKSGANSITFLFDKENSLVTFEVDIDDGFTVDDEVIVTPADNDDFHEFKGFIDSFRGSFISVRDAEDNVWDVYAYQLKKVEDME